MTRTITKAWSFVQISAGAVTEEDIVLKTLKDTCDTNAAFNRSFSATCV